MSNSVNFYESIAFVMFHIAVHELIFVYRFLLDRILVSMCKLQPKKPLKNLNFFRFFQLWFEWMPCQLWSET